MNPASLAAASDSVDVSGSLMIALLRVCLIVAVFVPVWSARPWAELYVGSLGATARIEWTAAVIDGWLVLAGVPGRRRRVVRAELRADLWRAAARGDLRAAVQALGPLREFAAAVPGGPRWIVGVVIGLVSLHLALGLRLTVEMTGVEGFFSGTRGEPGLAASWFSLSRGTWPWGADRVDLRLGILPLVIAGVVLVLVADPWRRRRTPAE